MQGLQGGRPLNGRLWSACGAWGSGPGGRGDAELFHTAGAASFHKSTNAVQTNGGKEASQEELRSPIKLSAKGRYNTVIQFETELQNRQVNYHQHH